MNENELKQALKEIIINSKNSPEAKRIIDDIINWNDCQRQLSP